MKKANKQRISLFEALGYSKLTDCLYELILPDTYVKLNQDTGGNWEILVEKSEKDYNCVYVRSYYDKLEAALHGYFYAGVEYGIRTHNKKINKLDGFSSSELLAELSKREKKKEKK